MKTYWPIILIALTFTPLAANAQAGGCGDPRAQICNPGQWADTSGDQTVCRACVGNTVANGCTRSCSACGQGTVPSADHSSCINVPNGCGDPRSQVCNPGQYDDTSANQDVCRACTGNTYSNGCTRSCSACGAGTIPSADHSTCVIPDGCGDPRAQNCSPGQYLNTNGNQDVCMQCAANAVANGCTRSCTTCGAGTVPDSYHGNCVACGAGQAPNSSHSACSECGAGTISDANHTSCNVCGAGKIANSNHTSCNACASNEVSNADHTSCSACGAGMVPDSDHGSCVPLPVVWSPHSRPFDVVWDTNSEDFNGLPWNPLWAWQLDNAGVPDFGSICGPAISDGSNVDANLLHQICTSQTVDVSTHWTLGAYCSGLINGHMTWTVAAQTGMMSYADWSGNYHWYDWQDGDYGVNFMGDPSLFPFPQGQGNPAAKCDGTNCIMTTKETSLGLEFNDGETIDNAGDPWFQQMVNQVENGNNASIPSVSQFLSPNTFGFPGVEIGMIGIDGVHGGYAESHPTFALALMIGETNPTANTLTEDWVFFLTNLGSGGGCSDTEWHWTTANNTYFIQLPGHPDATKMDIKGPFNPAGPSVWGWGGNSVVTMPRSADNAWTLIKVQDSAFPFGVDGEFTLTYTFPAGKNGQKKKAAPRAVPPGEKDKEDTFDVKEVASRITDPAVRAKFLADVQAAATQFMKPPAGMKRVPVKVDTTARTEVRTPGAASRGEVTRAVKVEGSVAQQRSEATKKLADTYGAKIPKTVPPK